MNTRFPIHITAADGANYAGAGHTVKAYKAGTAEFVQNAVKNTDDDGMYFFDDMVTGFYDIKVNDLYQKELRGIKIEGIDSLDWHGLKKNQYFVDPEAKNIRNHFTTIQAAIDAIPINGIGFINLSPTTYSESIVIQNKNVFISGMQPATPSSKFGTPVISGDPSDMTKPTIKINHTDHGGGTRSFKVGFRGISAYRYKQNGVSGNVFAENAGVLYFQNQGSDGLGGNGVPQYFDSVEFSNCNLRFQTWYTIQAAYAIRLYGTGMRLLMNNCHVGIGDHVSSGVVLPENRGWYKWFISMEDVHASQQASYHSVSAVQIMDSTLNLGKLLNLKKPGYGANSGSKAIELKGSSSSRLVYLFCAKNIFDIMNDKLVDVTNNGNAQSGLVPQNSWGINCWGINQAHA